MIERQNTTSSLVSIAEAATEVGVSRRTIERWIKDGRLHAVTSAHDRRKRMVAVEQVKVLAARPTKQLPSIPSNIEPVPNSYDARIETNSDEQWQEVMDRILRLVYGYYHRIVSQLHPESFTPLSLNQLRQGPLGQDLVRLAQPTNDGQPRQPPLLVREAVASVLRLLFMSASAFEYRVPSSFWETDAGQLLMSARRCSYKSDELMTVAEAATLLGVERLVIGQWIRNGDIDMIRDADRNEVLVVRRDVDRIKQIANQTRSRVA